MSKQIKIGDLITMEFPDGMSDENMEKIKQRIMDDVRAGLVATGQITKEEATK